MCNGVGAVNWLMKDITCDYKKQAGHACVPRWFVITTLVAALMIMIGALVIAGHIPPKGNNPLVSGSIAIVCGGFLLLSTSYFVIEKISLVNKLSKQPHEWLSKKSTPCPC